MGFKAIRESWNRNRREMGDQDAIRENMGFWKAKQGLSKTWDLKTKIGLILGRRTKREGGKEEKRKRKKKKRRREEGRSSQGMELWILVWKLTLIMDSMRFGMDFWVCMMIILSLNLGFL